MEVLGGYWGSSSITVTIADYHKIYSIIPGNVRVSSGSYAQFYTMDYGGGSSSVSSIKFVFEKASHPGSHTSSYLSISDDSGYVIVFYDYKV